MKKFIILLSLFVLVIFVIITFIVGNKPYSTFGNKEGITIECSEDGNQRQLEITSNEDIKSIREVLNSVKWTENIDIEIDSSPVCELKDDEVTLHIWYNEMNQIEVFDTNNSDYGRITGENVPKFKNIIE